MTARQFARATGYAEAYIRNACRTGKIPCEQWGGRWDISPKLIPLWAAKKNKRAGRSPKTIHNSATVYQRALDEYNRINGTEYSYGQAVMLGVICDE